MALHITSIDRDLYADLGVGENATPEEIKQAYRALARRLHPDVTPDPIAQQRFKYVAEAYATLSSAEQRRWYDLDRWLKGRSRARPAYRTNGQRQPQPQPPRHDEHQHLEAEYRREWQRKFDAYLSAWRQSYNDYLAAWEEEYQRYIRSWRREYDRWHGNTTLPYHERHDTLIRLSTELQAETQRLEKERALFRTQMQSERNQQVSEYEKELKTALNYLRRRPQWW